ncbi:MAG: hypothetical protein H7Z40_18355 [Phycisphaerae bacterium]|nr:hypothetical protein [Gemmatimonadaceae bacterium]
MTQDQQVMVRDDALEPDGKREVSLISLLTMLLRRRALIAWCALLTAVVFTGLALIGDRTWTTVVSFFPAGKKSGTNLSALAAQFGVGGIGAADANESPNFYADLVKSRAILSTVIDSGVNLPGGGGKVDLVTEYKIKSTNPALRREMATRKLNGNIAVATNVKTGVVTMRVSSTSAQLSSAIGLRLLDLLNKFNLDTRRSQASAERKFTEERLALVQADLRRAEDALQGFLQENRVIAPFSATQARRDRLEREVNMQQDLFTNLAKAFEQAKIDEVRDTPVITVVERPEPPARPDTRGVATKGISSLIGGFVLGCFLAIVLEGFSTPTGGRSGEQDEFHRLGRATLRDFMRPWRLLRSVKA